MITTSFTTCGISLEIDDSENDVIYCKELGEVEAEAAPEITRLNSERGRAIAITNKILKTMNCY